MIDPHSSTTMILAGNAIYSDPEAMGSEEALFREHRNSSPSNSDRWSISVGFSGSTMSLGTPSSHDYKGETEHDLAHVGSWNPQQRVIRLEEIDVGISGSRSTETRHGKGKQPSVSSSRSNAIISQSGSQGDSSAGMCPMSIQQKRQTWPRKNTDNYPSIEQQISNGSTVSVYQLFPAAVPEMEEVQQSRHQEPEGYADSRYYSQQTQSTMITEPAYDADQGQYTPKQPAEQSQYSEQTHFNSDTPNHDDAELEPQPAPTPAPTEPNPEKTPARERFLFRVMKKIRRGGEAIRKRALFNFQKFSPSLRKRRKPDLHDTSVTTRTLDGTRATASILQSFHDTETIASQTTGAAPLSSSISHAPGHVEFVNSYDATVALQFQLEQEVQNQALVGNSDIRLELHVTTTAVHGHLGAMSQTGF